MARLLEEEPDAEYERAFVASAIKSFESCMIRMRMDPGPGYYRPITSERRKNILRFYERAALGMYSGFEKRAAGYAESGDARQQRMARVFREAQQ